MADGVINFILCRSKQQDFNLLWLSYEPRYLEVLSYTSFPDQKILYEVFFLQYWELPCNLVACLLKVIGADMPELP